MRHLHLLPGAADRLPPGTVRPRPKTGLGPIHTRPRQPTPTATRPALYDRTLDPDETVFVPLTPLEWSLIVTALADRGQGNSLRPGSQAHADLAAKIRGQVSARTISPPHPPGWSHPALWTEPDQCPPTGMPR